MVGSHCKPWWRWRAEWRWTATLLQGATGDLRQGGIRRLRPIATPAGAEGASILHNDPEYLLNVIASYCLGVLRGCCAKSCAASPIQPRAEVLVINGTSGLSNHLHAPLSPLPCIAVCVAETLRLTAAADPAAGVLLGRAPARCEWVLPLRLCPGLFLGQRNLRGHEWDSGHLQL